MFTLPLGEQIERSPVALDDRRGMYFVGNFRHAPNQEAVEYLCAEILPLIDPELLEHHPLTVLGNWLDQVTLNVDPAAPGVRLVGWVPTIAPYIERSRIGVVPLLHGAGVKRKVIQSMMAGTPVVTTPVGAEGLDLVQGHHALIGSDAADVAAGITRLLRDDDLWRRLADAGAAHVNERHGLDLVEQRFVAIVEAVMADRRRGAGVASSSGNGTHGDTGEADDALRHRIQTLARPGEIVLVAVTHGEETGEPLANPCWPFPQGRDGAWAGYEPVDGDAAINHLEAQRVRGARYFVLPKAAFSWRYRFSELFEHLDSSYQRLHQDEHLAIYELAGHGAARTHLDPTPAARVLVLGTYAAHRTGPPPALLSELASSTTLHVAQDWRPDSDPHALTTVTGDADYVVTIRDDAILPSRFLDTLVATQATLGVDRLQPTHSGGPMGGPPITERHFGTFAREVDAVTPVPVLSVRAGADRDGPTTLADHLAIGLRHPLALAAPGRDIAMRAWTTGADRRLVAFVRPEPDVAPRISVLIATYDRPELLRSCLASFAQQTLPRSEYEVVVIDDGSDGTDLEAILAEWGNELQVIGLRIDHAGRSAAKNHAVFLARAPIVCFFDDDDRAEPDYLERHLARHAAKPGDAVAVLGHTDWAPELEPTPLMHYITDVDRLMFAYERLADGQELDWRGFWEGRISCKRALLLRHGLHDQRLGYSIDIEMGWRLAPVGLRVVYDSSARSLMARPIDFAAFCDRTVAKGRAHALIAAIHPGTDIASRLRIDDATTVWEKERGSETVLRRRVAMLEERGATDPSVLPDLHAAYRETFRLLHAKGAAGAIDGAPSMPDSPATVKPFANTDPGLVHNGTPAGAPSDPVLSITMPVWSRTPELAEMARETLERVWEVARIPTEVVVVDNGSPYEIPLPAKVYRYDENRGVATGWNTGIRLSSTPVVVVLNSDCMVEPGWDEALYEAATDGRRVAFPFTDHCDGLGFTRPDQGGTAGWCFILTKAVYEEVGVFDEWFNPAFCEDTDYWHRAWELGVELSPVPAAHVVHARRTSSAARSDLLLQAHRYKYGWKHDVDPDRAPPYYNREIVDYEGTFRAPTRRRTLR